MYRAVQRFAPAFHLVLVKPVGLTSLYGLVQLVRKRRPPFTPYSGRE
jgi:hypothetical protein